jgi:hypothetical protein
MRKIVEVPFFKQKIEFSTVLGSKIQGIVQKCESLSFLRVCLLKA